MNFALSDEQVFLKEAARGALARFKTVAAARDALDGGALPDLWPTAVEAGWPGLLVSEANGGAELTVLEATLVFEELGRVLASVPLLGHLPATHAARPRGRERRGRLPGGGRDPCRVRACSPAQRPRRRLERRSGTRDDACAGAQRMPAAR